MIRACDGHRGHGETGCGFSTSIPDPTRRHLAEMRASRKEQP